MEPAMRPAGPQARWEAYLREFNRQNGARLTRLGVIKPGESTADLWLEDCLPLAAVSLDAEGGGTPRVEIMLGAEGARQRSMTHTVAGVRKVGISLTLDGAGDSLTLEDEEGQVTLLRFEPRSLE